ncbi:MAG: hypothetical protein ACREXW_19625 [Gammaproteobacteria bacterium]
MKIVFAGRYQSLGGIAEPERQTARRVSASLGKVRLITPIIGLLFGKLASSHIFLKLVRGSAQFIIVAVGLPLLEQSIQAPFRHAKEMLEA